MIRTYKRGIGGTQFEYITLEHIGKSTSNVRVLSLEVGINKPEVSQTYSLVFNEQSHITHVRTHRPMYPSHRGRINRVVNAAPAWSYVQC